MKLHKLGALAAVSALAFAACSSSGASTAPSAAGGGGGGGDTSKGTIKISVDLPFQGSEKAASDPILNGIRLAVKDAGGAVGGWGITVPDSAVYDNALNGVHDPQTGANNMQK